MKITILNGNPDGENQTFEGYLARLTKALTADGPQTPQIWELLLIG
jgi:hypothetical protein